MLRQFHVEGFVSEYVQDAAGLLFTTVRIEIAEPGKVFEVYAESRFQRAR